MITVEEAINAISESLPIKHYKIPVQGFDPLTRCHILCTIPTFKDVWTRMSKLNVVMILYNLWFNNKFSAIYLSNITEAFFSLNFFGLQEMPYKGFTEYKDTRLSSFSSELKYVLNPNEFVFFGHPVVSMTDGEVILINNDYQDLVSRESLENMGFFQSIDKIYGNYMIIKNGYINYVYAGLKRNSMAKFRVGDKVKAGDKIAEVGCGGKMKRPMLHIECRLNCLDPEIWKQKFHTNLATAIDTFSPKPLLPMLKFEPFYNMPLIDLLKNTPEAVDRVLNRDIKYQYNAGTFIYPGYLIRKIK